jgi:hypothetical protein
MDEENLEKKDLKYVRQSMYRERRKLHPAQPKYQAEFNSILDHIGAVTNKDDDFVMYNDFESGIILFGCEANLKFLFTVSEEIFADGTYKCCSKYFKQLYTIHGFKNGHYTPLVFCLLPSKSEACHRKMFSLLDDSCKRFNLDLYIKAIHLDFEDRMHVTVTNLFPDVVI